MREKRDEEERDGVAREGVKVSRSSYPVGKRKEGLSEETKMWGLGRHVPCT